MKVAAIYGPRASQYDARPFQEIADARWVTDITDDLDAVLIFGGDGTIHRHLPRLSELKLPMLPVPNGSGNDFASGVGIHSVEDAMHAWHKFVHNDFNLRAIDLGAIHDAQSRTHLFCNVANLGLDAEVNRRANRLPGPIRSNGGYILSLLPSLLGYECHPVRIQCLEPSGGHDLDEPATLVVIANGRRYGHGLRIAPKANMSDGLFDICFVRQISKLKLASLFPIVYFGLHLGLREIRYFKARRLRIETPSPADIYADGEYLCQTPAEISIVEAGLRVITPGISV